MDTKNNKTHLLKPAEVIRDTYEIECFIGAGAFGEVYRVKHRYFGLQAIKVLRPEVASEQEFTKFSAEATILSHITHPNVVRVFEANSFGKDGRQLLFIAMEFVSGETLHQLLKRKVRISMQQALSLQRDICAGLSVAHRLSPPIIHRDIKPQNILLSYDSTIPQGKVSDFGLAKVADPNTRMTGAAGTVPFMAPEGFWDYYMPASDVFSAGIILYQMVTGVSPWQYDYSGATGSIHSLETAVLKARKKSPQKPSIINDLCDEKLESIIIKAIADKPEDRYKDATDFLNALIEYENKGSGKYESFRIESDRNNKFSSEDAMGFNGVAGMEELKDLLYSEIILPLQQKELYERYRIGLPNGILLYGPPGCGKTYIAKKLAEEVTYNFMAIKPSDLASTYVHGTQEKIGKLFRQAREKAPSIVLIDEIDAFLPERSERLDHHYSSEVNEFLSQVSDCSRDGIVLIGTTNRPDRIDPAALRTGRIDKIIYVPPPDCKARVALFNLFLKDRPISKDIDYAILANATENYIVSDIKAIVNDAARLALKEKTNIGVSHLQKAIELTKPSISIETIASYINFRKNRE